MPNKFIVMKKILTVVSCAAIAASIFSCAGEASRVASFNYVYCAPGFDPEELKKEGAPIFEGLGDLYYAVSTRSEKAQQYFNQGLTWAFAFNHGEAARSFREAARIDSLFAMAWWGYAWVLGPNINASMDLNLLEEANNAIDKAMQVRAELPEKEKMFIEAIRQRYPTTAPSDPKEMMKYSEAFAEAMRKMHAAYPDDVHITTIFAESLLDLHPWNYWNKDGEPLPWVKEIQDLLEAAIKIDPKHPGANHYYIHTMEASKTPEKAMKSADLLRDLLPAAGHLVHMPAHIYIRTGRYHDGTIANEKAAKADSHYITQCRIQGLYPLTYFPHNYHFMAATAFFEGNSKQSIDAAWLVAKFSNDKKMMREPGMGTLQHYSMIPLFTMVHFGKWDDILQLQRPDSDLDYPNAVWHYARGMAFAARQNLDSAKYSLEQLDKLSKSEQLETITVWELNKVGDIANIALNVLKGEIAYVESFISMDSATNPVKLNEAIAHLEAAMAIEDKLNYNEPPDWFFSVRHTLGNVLNRAGRYADAEKTYRRDLFLYPENGWSLIGLYNSLTGQGKTQEAAEVKKRFDLAWQWADVKISTSRVY
jgi:tetratricopeptide (TPR) repeat protein